METQNVTLALPKDVLRRAKRLAMDRRTSLSGLTVEVLTDLVEQDELYQVAADRQLALLERGLDFSTYGRQTWMREELPERNIVLP